MNKIQKKDDNQISVAACGFQKSAQNLGLSFHSACVLGSVFVSAALLLTPLWIKKSHNGAKQNAQPRQLHGLFTPNLASPKHKNPDQRTVPNLFFRPVNGQSAKPAVVDLPQTSHSTADQIFAEELTEIWDEDLAHTSSRLGKPLEDSSLTPSQLALFTHWDLSQTDLEIAELLPFFKYEEPGEIVVLRSTESPQTQNIGQTEQDQNADAGDFATVDASTLTSNKDGELHAAEAGNPQTRTLYVATENFMQSMAEQRIQKAALWAAQQESTATQNPYDAAHQKTKLKNPAQHEQSEQSKHEEQQEVPTEHKPPVINASFKTPTGANKETKTLRLEKNAFVVQAFFAGLRDDRKTRIEPLIKSPLDALQGPDYSLENFSSADQAVAKSFIEKVLSLGHGGTLVLAVAENGFIYNEPGIDFAIYENVFRRANGKGAFQEFARVGISNSFSANDVIWFTCDPKKKLLIGCAGVVPTDLGGDRFDMAEIGVSSGKYIWIQDIGTNANAYSPYPVEGADIDSIELFSAYSAPY